MAPRLLDQLTMMSMVTARGNDDAWLEQDALCLDLIRRALSTERVGFEMHLFRELPSTTEALRLLGESGAREGTVVLAETQHAGRTRFGRPWSAPERANVYAAVLFRPPDGGRAARTFGLLAALALIDALAGEGAPAGVRWPDEVVIDGRRVGRVITTAPSRGAATDGVIVGVEVNVNVSREALRRSLGAASAFVTSVREAAGHPIDRNRFTAAFLNRLEHWVGVYRSRGPGAVVRAWNDLDVRRGHVVELRAADGRQRGRVAGVDAEGRLVLEHGRGTERATTATEIVAVD